MDLVHEIPVGPKIESIPDRVLLNCIEYNFLSFVRLARPGPELFKNAAVYIELPSVLTKSTPVPRAAANTPGYPYHGRS